MCLTQRFRLFFKCRSATRYSRAHYASDASFKTLPYKLHLLTEPPESSVKITSAEALDIYLKMVTMREMERVAAGFYQQKKIIGFCHLYSGQEACAMGMFKAMRKDKDSVITSYRCHAWVYLFLNAISPILCELTGKKTGVSRGKGGSMHMYCKNFYGGNGIVGAQVPLGAGAGFANKYKKDGGVNFALYGDGAAHQGQIFEAYNMAKLLTIPCVFVCENNKYGMGTSQERHAAITSFYDRVQYIPGIKVSAMDFFTVYAASKLCIKHCSSGKGPLLMELNTYRYFGHSMSDPGTSYRSREEVQKVKETNDPILNFKKSILDAQLVQEAQLKELDKKSKADVKKASDAALNDPGPGMEEQVMDMEKNIIDSKCRNTLPWNPLKKTLRK